MTDVRIVLLVWCVLALVMTALWFVQRARGDAGIVDVAWSYGTGLAGAAFALTADGWLPRRLLIAGLAAFWGIRLGTYLVVRSRGTGEDGRYRDLRAAWGARAQRNLFLFFQLQATWAVLFAVPMGAAAANAAPAFGWLDALGVAVGLIALVGESVADAQLRRFRADPANRGGVCDVGLWRLSRHPNYFFEWVHWWAYVAFGIAGPWGWVTLFGPALMLVFLLGVTGIPPAEKRALARKGDAYRRYMARTNAFFPWPRTKGLSS